MNNHEVDNPISFGVFRSGVLPADAIGLYSNYGEIVSRLFLNFTWLETPQHVSQSSIFNNDSGVAESFSRNDDSVYINYVYDLCIDFIGTKSSSLLILSDDLFLSENFEALVTVVCAGDLAEIDVVSIWPSSWDEANMANRQRDDGLLKVNSFDRLAFLVTRSGVEKLLRSFDTQLFPTFSAWINSSNLNYYSVAEESEGRPWVYQNLWRNHEAYYESLRQGPNPALHPEASGVNLKLEDSNSSDIPIQIQAYISHWFSTWENVEAIEKACKLANYDVKVLNTTKSFRPDWINEIPISFFRQFEYACQNFDKKNEYMLFITADCRSKNWQDFFSSANRILRGSKIGTYSPTLSYEHFVLGFRGVRYFDYRSPIAFVHINDVIVTYIQRDVVLKMRGFFDYFSKSQPDFSPKVGHGISELLAHLVVELNLKAARDLVHTIYHPRSRSYDSTDAWNERDTVFQAVEEFLMAEYGSEFSREPVFPAIEL